MRKHTVIALTERLGYQHTSSPDQVTFYSPDDLYVGHAYVTQDNILEVKVLVHKDTGFGNSLCIYGCPIRWIGKPSNDPR